jgi:hypothetical protein
MAASYLQPITVIESDDEDEDSEGSLPPLGTESSDEDDVSSRQVPSQYPLVNGTSNQHCNVPAAVPTAVPTAVASRPGGQAKQGMGLRSGFFNAGASLTAAVVQKVTVDDASSEDDQDEEDGLPELGVPEDDDGPPELVGADSDHSDEPDDESDDESDDEDSEGPPGLEDEVCVPDAPSHWLNHHSS